MTMITRTVKEKIEQLIEIGETDKTKIYERIQEDFGIPRVQVRRISRELRQDLAQKIKILQEDAKQS